MEVGTRVPFERCYWVEPGRLLAGAYPGAYEPHESRQRLSALLDCGIRRLVSLMEVREESPDERAAPAYAPLWEELGRVRGLEVSWERHEIHDYSAPTREGMDAILRAIEGSLARQLPVYLHCWGGRGRTGTVVGAHLIRRGLATPDDFVDVIAALRAHDPGGGLSPESEVQRRFVRDYVLKYPAASRREDVT